MTIQPVVRGKKRYLDLLLLGDEQKDMIDRYLDRGEMFVLRENGAQAVCVITEEDAGVFEIKNLAVMPKMQRKGYGKKLMEFVAEHYRGRGHTLLVGTGESPLTIPFYEACGFVYSHRLPGFFTEHYNHPIFEGGCQLVDMVYLRRVLSPEGAEVQVKF